MSRFAPIVLALLLLASCSGAKERAAPIVKPKPPDGDILPPPIVTKLQPIKETDFVAANPKLAAVGRLLFFDKILSGNRDISCATCHHPTLAMGDGLSLPIGHGGKGLGPLRSAGTARARVSRNAPTLLNRGLKHFTTLFWDGRINATTADRALAAQALRPMLEEDEMRGSKGENEIADAPDEATALARLGARLQSIPTYRGMTMDDVARALAAYESTELRFYRSPLQKFLEGDTTALDRPARRGLDLFTGKGECLKCHHGPALSDGLFHVTLMPQVGPGRGGVGFRGHDDFGRELVTGERFDRYRFRTPSLLNVAVTGPWGHDGAVGSLDQMVRHYSDPLEFFRHYDRAQVRLPFRADLAGIDFLVLEDDASRAELIEETKIAAVSLTDAEVGDLVAFLEAMTDPDYTHLARQIPESVPSGLSVSD